MMIAEMTRKMLGKIKRLLRLPIRILSKIYHLIPPMLRFSIGAMGFVGLVVGGIIIFQSQQYKLTPQEQKLLGKASIDTNLIKTTDRGYSYERAEEQATKKNLVLASTAAESTGLFPYKAELPKDSSQGITFGNSEGDLSFKLVPSFKAGEGKYQDGRVIYPENTNITHVQTFKRNGIKEDIIFSKAPNSGTYTRSWELELGNQLEAKMLSDGSVGIYSSDQSMFKDVQVGDDKSQKLIDNAKIKAPKTALTFVIPAPFITDNSGIKDYSSTSYELKGNTLTLTAKNLKPKQYPLSIDPSVVVTTNNDFRRGSDDGTISYPGAGNVTRSNVSAGALGGFVATTSFPTARLDHATVAYNGYLYIIAGSSLLDDVQYAPINADGTIGTWVATTSINGGGRYSLAASAYNGYLYITGGNNGSLVNDVQYALINSDGSLGAWQYTFNSASSASYVGGFNTARYRHATVINNGFLYVIGGTGGGYQNDVQYAPLNANGTVGSWATTTSFTTARELHASAVYNGYLYVIGGWSGSYQNDVQYAPINANGTIGTWSTTTAFTTARYGLTTVASNGYLYVMGGNSGVRLATVQYAPINANGTIGTWTATTSFTTARDSFTSAFYNGYVYVMGGTGGSNLNDVQYAQILAPVAAGGGIAAAASTTSSLGTARSNFATVAYNGYLYLTGGIHGTSDTACNGTASLYCSDVMYAAINADGTIGSWIATTSLPNVLDAHASVANNGFLYVLGGFSGAGVYRNAVLYAPFNANGSLGAWTATTSFATARQGLTSVVYNGYIYVLGGLHATSDTACNAAASTLCSDVQYALICTGSNSGTGGCGATAGTVGTWMATTSFPTARYAHTSVVYNGYVYVIGGLSGAYLNDVQYAPINAAGTIGAWASAGTGFTNIRDYHSSVVANGYLYVIGGWNGTTYFNDIQYAPINAAGTIGAWITSTNGITTARYGQSNVFTNGYLYTIGGYHPTSDTACNATNNNYCSDVQYTLIQPGASGDFSNFGTVNTWNATTSFTTARHYQTSVAYNGYIYILGGEHATSDTLCNATASTMCSDVQYAPINKDGTIGTWNSTSSFSTARFRHTSVVSNGFIYLLGGVHPTSDTACHTSNSQYCSDVQYAPINANGTLGSWSPTTSMSVPRGQHTTAIYNGYVYVTGGFHPTSDTACNTANSTICSDVIYALICTGNNNGVGGCGATPGTIGTWNTTGNFSTARYVHTSVAYNGYLYVIGGFDGSVYRNDVQVAAINATTGTVGTWTATTAFTTIRGGHTSVAYNGYLYVIGGSNGTFFSDVQKATINANGTVGTWTTTTAFTTARQNHATVTYDGYLYVAGGCSVGSCTAFQNDVQKASFNGPALMGHYDRTVDIGFIVDVIDSIQYNGTAKCGAIIQYATAGTSGTYGALTTLTPSAIPGVTYLFSGATLKRYLRLIITLNDETCGGNSSISDLTINYSFLPPAAPTLSAPASGNINTSLTPVFQLKTTDALDIYARYKILLYQSDCTTLIRTIDQTASQTGWTGQDSQTSTAYVTASTLASSTLASHSYQAPALNYNTTYCWKAQAIDPAGSNTFGAFSATQSFTTNQTPAAPLLTLPANSQTGLSTLPELRFYSIDADSDYLRYKIEVYQSDCSTLVRTIDQTVSQTGWRSQSQQAATAYSSGQEASHVYQLAGLAANTTYCWRAQAVDPAGTNIFSAFSSNRNFTTGVAAQANINIGGGTTIHSGTTVGQ